MTCDDNGFPIALEKELRQLLTRNIRLNKVKHKCGYFDRVAKG